MKKHLIPCLLTAIVLLVLASILVQKNFKDEHNSVGASYPPLILEVMTVAPNTTEYIISSTAMPDNTDEVTVESTSTPVVTECYTSVPTSIPTILTTPTSAPTAVPNIDLSNRGECEYVYKITALGTAYTIGNDNWGNQVLWSCGVNYLPTFQDVPGIPDKNSLNSMYKEYVNNHSGQYGYKKGELHTRWGVVAVDPRVIPLGTALYIESCDSNYPDYGYAIAVDIGGFIRRNSYSSIQKNDYSNLRVVDMWMETDTQCYNWGVRPVNIYILEDQTVDIFKLREEGYHNG